MLGDPNAPRPVLVVGCIHGNETAGITVADREPCSQQGVVHAHRALKRQVGTDGENPPNGADDSDD